MIPSFFLLQLPASILEVYLCYCYVNGFYQSPSIKYKKYYITLAVMLGLLLCLNRTITSFFSWAMLLIACGCVWISLLINPTNLLFKFSIVFLYNVCSGIFQLLCFYLIIFWNQTLNISEIYRSTNYYRILCYTLVSIFLLFIYKKFFIRFILKNINNKCKWLFLLYGITGLFFIMIIQNRLFTLGRNRMLESLAIFVLLLISIVLAFIGSSEYFTTKTQLHAAELKEKLLEENYIEIKNIYEHYMYNFHDFKNHLLVLMEYCQNRENEKAIDYISSISAPLHKTKLFAFWGNDILDIILNYKLQEAESAGINIETHVQPINIKYIEEIDLCAIISNLLDNAITACEDVPENEKTISVTTKDLGETTIIKISNSYKKNRSKPNSIFFTGTPSPVHGYGKKSVKSKVEKYNGTIVWKSDGKIYSAIITFNNANDKTRGNEIGD